MPSSSSDAVCASGRHAAPLELLHQHRAGRGYRRGHQLGAGNGIGRLGVMVEHPHRAGGGRDQRPHLAEAPERRAVDDGGVLDLRPPQIADPHLAQVDPSAARKRRTPASCDPGNTIRAPGSSSNAPTAAPSASKSAPRWVVTMRTVLSVLRGETGARRLSWSSAHRWCGRGAPRRCRGRARRPENAGAG